MIHCIVIKLSLRMSLQFSMQVRHTMTSQCALQAARRKRAACHTPQDSMARTPTAPYTPAAPTRTSSVSRHIHYDSSSQLLPQALLATRQPNLANAATTAGRDLEHTMISTTQHDTAANCGWQTVACNDCRIQCPRGFICSRFVL